jgi:hypothetical protein
MSTPGLQLTITPTCLILEARVVQNLLFPPSVLKIRMIPNAVSLLIRVTGWVLIAVLAPMQLQLLMRQSKENQMLHLLLTHT